MCFNPNKNRYCYYCGKKIKLHKFLKCDICKEYYHYKCAYKLSKHLNQCLLCDKVTFALKGNSYFIR